MITVFIGGSGSGKSEMAEAEAVRQNRGSLVYLATMQPFDDESRKRIRRHQRLRADRNFQTVECFTELKGVNVPERATVLLECMSNLVANEMFSPAGAKEDTLLAVKQGIEHLAEQTDNLLIVTNNLFEDGICYDAETMKYLKILGELNQWLCLRADRAVEAVHGIALEIKA